MKLSKEQKALGAVLGVALIACLADRLFVLEPAPAAAENVAVATPAARAAVKPVAASAKIVEPEITIAERLNSAVPGTRAIKSDPFSMEDKWMGPKATVAAGRQVDLAEVFCKK